MKLSPPNPDVQELSEAVIARDCRFSSAGLHFHLRRHEKDARCQSCFEVSSGSHLISIALSGDPRFAIQYPDCCRSHCLQEGEMDLRLLEADCRVLVSQQCELMSIELGGAALSKLAARAGFQSAVCLRNANGFSDPVLLPLAMALRHVRSSPLVTEKVVVAMATHIIRKYGAGSHRKDRASGGLSRRNQNLAREIILSGLQTELSVSDLARECGMSRSAFSHAFKRSLGKSPYQWILAARVDLARKLLTDPSLSLDDVASRCGLTPGAHFSRVFARHAGMPPTVWRRNIL